MFPILWAISATILVIGFAWCSYWFRQSHGTGEWWFFEPMIPGAVLSILGLTCLVLTTIAKFVYWCVTNE
jgi:hypothetical protein